MRSAASKAHSTFSSTAHVCLAKASSQPSGQASAAHFKRRGRNARKHSTRFFVFPELVLGDPTAEQRLQASSTVSQLLKDLRVPTSGLPIRFFLTPEQSTPDSPAAPLPRAVAVPDFRTVQALAKAGSASSADAITALISTADSLRTLDALISAGSATNPAAQARATAAAFIRLRELVNKASAGAYTHFPCNLHGGLPHVAASAALQGQPAGAASTDLLMHSARSLARRRLVPALTANPSLLPSLTPVELAGTAEALAWLQPEAESPLASEVWEHVRSVAQQRQFTVQDMGPASKICNAISQAQARLPLAALEAAALLQPQHTWLAAANCAAAEAHIQGLPASQTVACWLAAHSCWQHIQETPAALAVAPAGGNSVPYPAAAGQQPLPWRWLQPTAWTVQSVLEQSMLASEAVRQALHSRILQSTPGSDAPWMEEPVERFSWPQHGPEILSALHHPLHPQDRRAALRPLFAAAVEAMMQPRPRDARGSRRLIAVGHVLALMDLANVSGAALTLRHSDSVKRFLTFACEELQAHTVVLSAHEVASSVLLLGEILSMQGSYTRLTCDAAYGYLASLFRSEAVQPLQFTSMERLMLCSGIQRLFGSRPRNVWCSQLEAHLTPRRADPASRRTQGPGKAMQVPMMHSFCQRLGDLSAVPLSATPAEASEEARCMLATVGAVGMKYQDEWLQVIMFLRAAVAVLHDHLRHGEGAGYTNKALAHILLALGELQVPFETVYPLVLRICDLLQARVDTMDVTECYLAVDALAKLRTPTPEASPLLLAVMAHLAHGLELRPARPALHLNLRSTPPSQLIKLANAIKGFMPQTHGLVTREMQTAPKAAFVRLLVSHIMRHCAADLTHRDLIRILRLLKDSALGRDVPKPWTQDVALRIIDRFSSHLFGAPAKPLDEAAYWQGQELRDVTYLGVAASAPVPRPRRLPLTPQLWAGATVSPVTGSVGLAGADLLPEGPEMPCGGDAALQAQADAQAEPVRWAYGKAYAVVQDSSKLILGSLKVMDWDTHLLHAVETLVANMGPRGLTGQPTVLEETLTAEGTSMQVWKQAGYHGQDAPEELAEPRFGTAGRGRGGRGRGRIKQPFAVPHAPDPATLAGGGTNRPMQMHRGFEAFDAAQLLVAIADVYGDSASAGRSLCRRTAPGLFSLYAPTRHRPTDLARMLWALGVLADPAEPQLWQSMVDVVTALRLCNREMHRMHPKFTMLAMKGLATMARGGQLYGGVTPARPWKLFESAAHTDEARRAVRGLESDAHMFARRAAGYLAATLSAEMSESRSCSLRPEGIGEAVRSATLLCPKSATLEALWGVGMQTLRAHAAPQEVPLRAVTALLESAVSVKAGPAAKVQASVEVLARVARSRLLHGKRRVAPLQVRRFVAALRRAAPVAPVRDGGLITAVLREVAGSPMIANAKNRGRRGSERFVRMFEEIAELQDYGAVFVGGAGDVSAGVRATVRADETLVQRLEGVMADAEAACLSHGEVEADLCFKAGVEKVPRRAGGAEEQAHDEDAVDDGSWEAEVEAMEEAPAERLDYSLEGRVGRIPWKETAWDEQLVMRLRGALQAILGR